MNILGISCFYHEAAAALIIDGAVTAAAAEERFSRIKHDASFPHQAIGFCLHQTNLTSQDLDYVVFYEKPFQKFHRNLITALEEFPGSFAVFTNSMRNFLTQKLWIKSIISEALQIPSSKILFVAHHLSHAAASFYTSPFESAAFLTVDGVGEWTTASWGTAGKTGLRPAYEMKYPHSIGLLYSAFTAYLGFAVNDGEYKVMGMAGYGKPIHLSKIKKMCIQHKDSSIKLNMDYFLFQSSSESMYSPLFERELAGLNPFDIAASIQIFVEDLVMNMVNHVYKKTRQDYLVYGGGVALNCVLNERLVNESDFKDVFIFPAAGDDGGAVGAALYVYYHFHFVRHQALQHVFWGQSFPNSAVQSFLNTHRLHYRYVSNEQKPAVISQLLAEQKVVGLFEGQAEFGPRALGHRSILADPRKKKMKTIVNQKIKFREEFRPFAPVVLSEHAQKYFKTKHTVLEKFMLQTCQARTIAKLKAPAVVHVDGRSRIQRIVQKYPGNLRRILEEFYAKTGVPVLLNTSFNIKGEPIVNSPADAYNTFLQSGLDVVVLENYLLEK